MWYILCGPHSCIRCRRGSVNSCWRYLPRGVLSTTLWLALILSRSIGHYLVRYVCYCLRVNRFRPASPHGGRCTEFESSATTTVYLRTYSDIIDGDTENCSETDLSSAFIVVLKRLLLCVLFVLELS